MKQFAIPLAISGTLEQLEALIPKLEALGYKWNSLSRNDFLITYHNKLVTGYGQQSETWGMAYFRSSNDRQEVSADNEELVLALAAMTEGEEPQVGEIWVMEKARGWGYDASNNGCLALITQTCVRTDVFYYHTEKISVPAVSGQILNPKVDRIEFSNIPIRCEDRVVARKATKEEIINYFTNKTQDMSAKQEYVKCIDNEGAGCQLTVGKSYRFIKKEGSHVYVVDNRGEIDWFNESRFDEEANLIGFKAPFDLFKGRIKAGSVFTEYSSEGFVMYNKDHMTSGVPTEIVETWEPVFEEEKIEFEGYTAEFIDNNSAVKFGCQFFTREEVEQVRKLLKRNSAEGVAINLLINGESVTLELLNKIYAKMAL